MRSLVLLLLCLSLATLCQAVEVLSVVADDLGAETNRLSIRLSAPAQYSIQAIAGGKGFLVVIPNAEAVSVAPAYRRLSRVIDTIKAWGDSRNAYVEVLMMADYPYTHQWLAGQYQIEVMINPVASRTVTPATTLPPAAVEPSPVLTRTATPPERTAESEPSDSLSSPDPLSPVTATSKVRPPHTPLRQKLKPYAPYFLAGFGVLLLLALLWLYLHFRPRRKSTGAEKENLEGSTLMLDTQTKTRMVHRLVEQGWTAREIDRELKLSPKEVEHIIALGQISGYGGHH